MVRDPADVAGTWVGPPDAGASGVANHRASCMVAPMMLTKPPLVSQTAVYERSLPMVRRMGRGWWDGCDARRGHGPDQQNGAGGVVDDEPAGRAEASGSKVGAVAVAGYDEQIGAFGGGDDLPFEASRPFHPGARASQAFGGGVEELGGEGSAEVFQAGAGVALGVAAAEQAGVGAVRDAGDVVVAHV